MSQPSRAIDAQIQAGDVSGQIAVGDHIYQNQYLSAAGDIVFRQADASLTELRRLPEPARPALRRFPGFLGRSQELALTIRTLNGAEPVDLHGPSGVGKSSFLRRLAQETPSTPDGAFYARARGLEVNDLKQMLVDAFYESAMPVVLRPGQYGRYLAPLEAIIMLDDVNLPADDVLDVLDAARGCTFVLAGEERRLRGEGRSIGLSGLAAEEAVELVARELGRDLSEVERGAALAICQALDGHPGNILAEAARIREEGLSLAEAAAELQTDAPTRTLQDKTAAGLSDTERQILALMQGMADVPLHQEQIQALVGRADTLQALQSLQGRQLAQAHSPSYTATALLQAAAETGEPVGEPGPEEPNWSERLLSHFVDWTTEHRDKPALLQERMEAILHLFAWGQTNEHWTETLTLARNIQGALALARRWDAWRGTLEGALQAARAIEQPADEAWALHQLGARSLCLGDYGPAEATLRQALEMRQALGDEAGAAVTRQCLDALPGGPFGFRGGRHRGRLAGGLSLPAVLVAVVIAVGLRIGGAIIGAPRVRVENKCNTPLGGTTDVPILGEVTVQIPANDFERYAIPPGRYSFLYDGREIIVSVPVIGELPSFPARGDLDASFNGRRIRANRLIEETIGLGETPRITLCPPGR